VKRELRDAQLGENSAEIEADELREFLAADLYAAQIDPKFKEELRQALWDFVRGRTDRESGDASGDVGRYSPPRRDSRR